MKYSAITFSSLALMAAEVLAFPTGMLEKMDQEAKRCPYADIANAAKKEKRAIGFDAATQHIDVSGAHAFVAPNFAKGDIRGPCPGLNALANHNYLPHDGVITLTDAVNATNAVFGMGIDLGTFLSTYATVTDGDPLTLTWSIGGAPAVGSVAGLLSPPQGLTGSHNKYETDSSPTRGDYYQFNGNNYALQMQYFKELYALQADAAAPNYNLDVLLQHRKTRFQQSIAQNPYFFYGPFSGIEVSQAAFTFIYRFMSNKSAEYPEGVLNKEVLKSFFAVSGSDNALVYTAGHERIPKNWYKRAIGDEYTIPFFQLDLVSFALQYPILLSPGGNTGGVNTYTAVDVSNLTGGVYNAKNLLEGNNLACFGLQVAALGEPDILKGELADITSALGLLTSAVAKITTALSCPQLTAIDASTFDAYPGYVKSPYYKR